MIVADLLLLAAVWLGGCSLLLLQADMAKQITMLRKYLLNELKFLCVRLDKKLSAVINNKVVWDERR
jgi:hypothetical protein